MDFPTTKIQRNNIDGTVKVTNWYTERGMGAFGHTLFVQTVNAYAYFVLLLMLNLQFIRYSLSLCQLFIYSNFVIFF